MRDKIKLVSSAGTGHYYTTTKNKRTMPDKMEINIRVLNPEKRPVSAVGDQQEVRDVSSVKVAIDRAQSLTMLFDPEHALDDRIAMEQLLHELLQVH